MPLDIVLHTPGGLVLAATQIARAIQGHKGKVTVFVPHYAMSGGTLIALAADEIVMCEHSVLGPVDPQLGQLPAASLLKVVAEKLLVDSGLPRWASLRQTGIFHPGMLEIRDPIMTHSPFAGVMEWASDQDSARLPCRADAAWW